MFEGYESLHMKDLERKANKMLNDSNKHSNVNNTLMTGAEL